MVSPSRSTRPSRCRWTAKWGKPAAFGEFASRENGVEHKGRRKMGGWRQTKIRGGCFLFPTWGGGVGFGAREEEGRTVAGGGGASDVVPLLQSEQLSKNRQLIEMGGCEEGCFDLYVAHVFVQRVVLCWLPTRALHRKKTSALEIVRFDACKAQTRARFFLLCASAFWREKRETKIFWSRTRIKCLVVGYEPTCNIDLSETSKLWSVFVTILWQKTFEVLFWSCWQLSQRELQVAVGFRNIQFHQNETYLKLFRDKKKKLRNRKQKNLSVLQLLLNQLTLNQHQETKGVN